MNDPTPLHGLRSPSEVLSILLDRHGLSQKQFAEMLSVSRAHVNNVLKKKSDLSLDEYTRWLGALGYEPPYGAVPSPTAGYFRSRDEVWPWLLKRLKATRKPEPQRIAGELLGVLEQAGVERDGWPTLLPSHLAPILASGWLWREGPDTPEQLAAKVAALRESRDGR